MKLEEAKKRSAEIRDQTDKLNQLISSAINAGMEVKADVEKYFPVETLEKPIILIQCLIRPNDIEV